MNRALLFPIKSNGQPATIARHPKRGDVVLIVWTTTIFADSYPPEVRCRSVSERFQRTNSNGTLNYIVSGEINGHPALCASRSKPTNQIIECTNENLLMLLRPEDDPQQMIRQIADLNVDASTNPIFHSAEIIEISPNGVLAGIDVGVMLRYSSPSNIPDTVVEPLPSCLFDVCISEPSKRSSLPNMQTDFTVLVSNHHKTGIVEAKKSNYSGVIIAHKNNNYYVITGDDSICAKDKTSITTTDGRTHNSEIKYHLKNLNIYILLFVSNQNYGIAPIDDSKLPSAGDTIYILGSSNSLEQFGFSEGSINSVTTSHQNSIFRYDNITSSNMKGGAILDIDGNLIGIHSKAGLGISINDVMRVIPLETLQFLE